ncbi:hypothetical protein ACFVAV_18410 [Nocardia sp. NPDC057663]|uniref:hypothetical protein n=1 Tax=Nocardia sp. NPDC057663 TaxID=3346201 RepID=UPI00366E2AAF
MTNSKPPNLFQRASESVTPDLLPTRERLPYTVSILPLSGVDRLLPETAGMAEQTGVSPRNPRDRGIDRDGVVLRHRLRPTTATETNGLFVIARLDAGDAAVDVYSSEFYCGHASDGAVCARTTAIWSRSLRLEPGTSADLDGLDRTLAAAGYCRVGGWRVRVTANGAVRYFADATTSSR